MNSADAKRRYIWIAVELVLALVIAFMVGRLTVS